MFNAIANFWSGIWQGQARAEFSKCDTFFVVDLNDQTYFFESEFCE